MKLVFDETMDSIKETFADILKPKSSLLSKCLGVAIATVFYYFASMVTLPIPCCQKNANHRRQSAAILNSLVLSAAYLYSWTESNPHKAEASENTPITEVPLMLTAGYYVLDILSYRSFIDVLHHIVSISAILLLLVEGSGANVGVTFGFLVEVANLVYYIKNIAMHFQSPCQLFLNIFYLGVFILVRVIALLHLSYNIVNNKDLPEVGRSLAGILFMMSFFYCFRMFQHVFGTQQEPGSLRRPRSRTPLASRTSKRRKKSRSSRCRLTFDEIFQ